jgi:hypothetical protein
LKDKGHFYTSLIKSIIRILACICAIWRQDVTVLAFGFAGAEVLGIIEEIFDKR